MAIDPDLHAIIIALEDGRQDDAVGRIAHVEKDVLQRMVDLGASARALAEAEARRRGTHLFTPWASFDLASKE